MALASLPLIVSRENFQVAFNVLDIKIALGLIFFLVLTATQRGEGEGDHLSQLLFISWESWVGTLNDSSQRCSLGSSNLYGCMQVIWDVKCSQIYGWDYNKCLHILISASESRFSHQIHQAFSLGSFWFGLRLLHFFTTFIIFISYMYIQ